MLQPLYLATFSLFVLVFLLMPNFHSSKLYEQECKDLLDDVNRTHFSEIGLDSEVYIYIYMLVFAFFLFTPLFNPSEFKALLTFKFHYFTSESRDKNQAAK